MNRELVIDSPAKVNLHLEIGPKREDGYHGIRSLFQQVSLCDTLEMRSLTDTDSCRIEGDFGCSTEQNLIFKAFRLFREETGISGGIDVRVVKRIPEGAGLGGGSSNAASTLIGLNSLFQTDLSANALTRLGARLGSDVPFFCSASLAYVGGRGEEVFPIPGARRLPLLLILPSFSVSTSEAYGWLDEENRDTPFRFDHASLEREYEENPAQWRYFNAFTPALIERHPQIKGYLEKMRYHGAAYAELSGSGSALFGVFSSKAAAHRAAKGLKELKDPIQVLTIETLDRFGERILQY